MPTGSDRVLSQLQVCERRAFTPQRHALIWVKNLDLELRHVSRGWHVVVVDDCEP